MAVPVFVTTQALVGYSRFLLDTNHMWSGSVITYSIPTAGSAWPGYSPGSEPFVPTYGVLNAMQAANFRLAIGGWDAAYRGELNETNDLVDPGRIRVAFTTSAIASTRGPPADPFVGLVEPEAPHHGDVWLPSSLSSSSFSAFDLGTHFNLLVRSVGEALGLRRLLGVTSESPEYDNMRFSVMSTTVQPDYLAWHVAAAPSGPIVDAVTVLPTTPMVLDVFTMEVRYGAPTANPGDTVYSWSEDLPIMMTVVDTDGIDTWDLSTHHRGSIINLTPAAYSSIGYYPTAQQLADLTARHPALAGELAARFAQPGVYEWALNVGIAYKTVIENVRGGSGADGIQGNAAANQLFGGAGDDFLDGADGNDRVDGGAGADRVFGGAGADTVTDKSGANYLRGDEGNDSVGGGADFDDINGNMGNDTAYGGLGDDWVIGGKDQDLLFGEAGADLVYGNLGSDTCHGDDGADTILGGQANDEIYGGGGADFVSGDRGDDTVTGGTGADIFHTFAEAGLDRVLDFTAVEGDRVLLDPGTQYSVAQVGADTVITMVGGGQMVLVGIQLSSLPAGWIFVG